MVRKKTNKKPEKENPKQKVVKEKIEYIDLITAYIEKYNQFSTASNRRALPDVRDGLKLSQRRILYSMFDLGLYPDRPYKKCARIVGECFVKGTLVSTPKGLIPIEELNKGDLVYTQNSIEKVSELYIMPKKKLKKVTLENGLSNVVTPFQSFKVLTKDLEIKWKKTEDLTTEDYIITKPTKCNVIEYQYEKDILIDEDMAYVLGFFLADGWIHRGKYFTLGFKGRNEKKEVILKIKDILENKFKTNIIVRKNLIENSILFEMDTKENIFLSNKLIDAFNLENKYAENITVPNKIFISPESVKFAFISGFIDGDGSIHKNRNVINITSISKKFIEQLNILLFEMGIISNFYTQKERLNKINNKEFISSEIYSLEITSTFYDRLNSKLSLNHSTKDERLQNIEIKHSKFEKIPYLGRYILEEFSKKHLGGGWYLSKDGKKIRCGLKDSKGKKIRYSSDILDSFSLNRTNIYDLNILTKMEQIGSKYLDLVNTIINDNIYFIKVKDIVDMEEEVTYDIQVENKHEFIANGKICMNCLGKYHPHGDCLRGDTLLFLVDGKITTIKELYELKKEVNILAVDTIGNIHIAKAHNFRIGQYTDIIYKIKLSNGGIIQVTNNHPVLLKDLIWVKAEDLKKDMILYSKTLKSNFIDSLELSSSNLISIVDIEIEHVNKEPMYDFTVDNFENMLIPIKQLTDNSYSMISVHNSSVYDSLVRMAQDFNKRYPLIDGQGNYGTIDDAPAAYRYCVTGDTYINTSKGLIQIQNIVRNSKHNSTHDIDLSILSMNNKRNKAIKFFNSGLHDIYKITTMYGYSIKGTSNHPLLTFEYNKDKTPVFKWKTLDKLKINDYLVINSGGFNEEGNNLSKEEIDNCIINLNTETVDKVLCADKKSKKIFINKLFNENNIYKTRELEILEKIQLILLEFGVLSDLKVNYIDKHKLVVKNIINLSRYLENNSIIELNNKLIYLPVRDISYIGKDVVYSIKVDSECHSFVANGFINHNTEARLTENAMNMLKYLNNKIIDFIPNFDDEETEPTILPAIFPNLLVNGTKGVGVGIKSTIPPHNLTEIINGIIAYIDNPKISIKDMLKYIPAPDFPCGGYISGDFEKLYTTGEGFVFLEGTVIKEKNNLIVTSIPYQVKKKKIIEKFNEVFEDYKLDITDESDKNGIRIVFELTKSSKQQIEDITQKINDILNIKYHCYFKVLYKGNLVEGFIGLLDIIKYYVDDKIELLKRKFNYDLEKLEQKLHLLTGLVKALNDIDYIINTIRSSKNNKEIFDKLKNDYTVEQIKYILDIKLSGLVSLEIEKVKKEKLSLQKEITKLKKILKSKKLIEGELKKEMLLLIPKDDKRMCKIKKES